MIRTLLIDDVRNIDATKVCRTYDEGIEALRTEEWETLYLDHDLGDPDPKKTGYGIACFIEENPSHRPYRIQLVSQNPVGRANIIRAISKFYWTNDGWTWWREPEVKE